MEKAPIPKNEKERLLSLYKLGLLDTKPEERFDRITRTATKIFNVPISTLTLIDAKREWFKSCVGLPVREGDRAISFCGHALLANDVFVIPDTKKDKRFLDNPMVIGKPFIRFYAGVPIVNADGERVGVFCVKDTKPRKFSKNDKEILKNLAAWAELEVNSRNLSLALAEEKKLQKKLTEQYNEAERSKAKDEAILASVGDGMIVVDKNRKIIFFSKSTEEITKWKAEDAVGRHTSEIMQMEDEKGHPIPANQRPIHQALATRKTITTIPTTSYYLVFKDGRRFPATITATPVIYKKGIIGAILIFRDVTKEKEIDKAKSEFISLASHQLKTPPTAIKLLTERLLSGKMGEFNENQKEYFREIRSSNQRMIDLVNALLNVSRIELGAFTIQVSKKNVSAVISGVLDELQSLIEKKKLKLKTALEKNMMLMLDESLFRIIINNLVTNAINYTAEGGSIRVESKIAEKGEMLGKNILKEKSFVFIVSDTGQGIPQKEQSRIFTKLFRADNAIEQHTDGTGLGLYLSKSILDHCGGSIWFTSRENEGSVFYAAIPIAGMKAKSSEKMLIGR
ncbi:MAG: Histidine kinase,histidine kinase,PAS domain-containing protein,GAF domain-containing protein [Candidatus Nomurabacteria bacterium GW2011_GWF2_43_8]|uniref:histidine kinase n=1 Tax=Candidatus Nomurabacteria bacterium GW2011_GWF2_43_8 TaxID=1618779 RepID=A0A0G1FR39_9BACT|nr:MAG: Histidine kinase,histidine kinase,PAS domain-containing protein,GAF domain-containing protein [Candidatus Nomurabacteria bacterium GW2011_GWF2_43_8]